MPTELPSAAWFAEHAMKWKAGIHDGIGAYYHDEQANYDYWISEKQDQHSWDPRTNDADALQLLDSVALHVQYVTIEHDNSVHSQETNQSWYCCFSDNEEAGYEGDARAHDNILRLAICRAVEAYVLAKEGATHAD